MAKTDPTVEQILAECQEAYQSAETHSALEPPDVDGDYTCELTAVREGVRTDEASGASYIWMYPIFRVCEGEYDGREFRGSFMGMSAESSDKARANVQRLKEFAMVANGGSILATAKEAYMVARAAVGEFFRINISTSSQGRRFVNVRELLSSAAEEA